MFPKNKVLSFCVRVLADIISPPTYNKCVGDCIIPVVLVSNITA